MEDNKSEDRQQSESSSAENQESTTESNTTVETNTSEENKTEPTKAKFKLPKIKLSFSGIKKIYEGQYKKLLILPVALLLIAILIIGFNVAATGDFINRDVSLKGGVTVTIPTTQQVDISQLKDTLSSIFLENDISTKSLSQFGTQIGVIVEVDIGEENREKQIKTLIEETGRALNLELTTNDYSIEIVGSSLGDSFFREIITALIIAFLLMAIVIFLYFRTIIPSAAVILAVFSDILITLAVVNLLGLKISTAGIAAFLMLIGYSVDTNILLSTRVLKRKEGTEMERFYGAFKTGIMMSSTTLIALTVALIFTQSEIIKQIMTILIIGLLIDLINTWIQNVAILRWYLERKAKKATRNEL
jgi:preprotein translocase subunit SecF